MKKKRDSRRLADSRVICRATFFGFLTHFITTFFPENKKKKTRKKTTVVLLSNPIGISDVPAFSDVQFIPFSRLFNKAEKESKQTRGDL